MAWRTSQKTLMGMRRLLMGAVSTCLLLVLYLSTSTPSTTPTLTTTASRLVNRESHSLIQETSHHHLTVIVPFRNRFEELLIFAPYLHQFLSNRNISHDILVVNQVDNLRFNRAALINIGFLHSSGDYIAMHDVDLLPLNPHLPYVFPEEGTVLHVAGPGLHPKYNYPSFIGGILLVPSSDFRRVNGMSNVYWGWGMEDDEFYVRLKHASIQVKRPEGLSTGMKDTFRHTHSPSVRPRDTAKCHDQYNRTRRRDKLTGLSNVNYTFISESRLSIDNAPLVVINVELICETTLSPWCTCEGQGKSPNSIKSKKNPKSNGGNGSRPHKKNK